MHIRAAMEAGWVQVQRSPAALPHTLPRPRAWHRLAIEHTAQHRAAQQRTSPCCCNPPASVPACLNAAQAVPTHRCLCLCQHGPCQHSWPPAGWRTREACHPAPLQVPGGRWWGWRRWAAARGWGRFVRSCWPLWRPASRGAQCMHVWMYCERTDVSDARIQSSYASSTSAPSMVSAWGSSAGWPECKLAWVQALQRYGQRTGVHTCRFLLDLQQVFEERKQHSAHGQLCQAQPACIGSCACASGGACACHNLTWTSLFNELICSLSS